MKELKRIIEELEKLDVTNEELAEELNQLMHKLEEIESEWKPIPYLGWFWRDIDKFDSRHLPLSLPEDEDFLWLDIPRKWSYPFYICNEIESRKVLELLIDMVNAFLKYLEYTNKLKKKLKERS